MTITSSTAPGSNERRPEAAPGAGFAGNERFQIKRRLGEGSMGAVYLAYDRERAADVALKTLRRVDAAGIYRFKREFRALSDVVHPNLVVLHDLFCEDDEWFFTMQYVEGQDFLSYVLGSSRRTLSPTPHPTPEFYESGEQRGRDAGELTPRGLEMLFPSPMRDEERLRHGLIQIAHGLLAIHAAGKLHRDLKSDNVLVTAEGHAKVLDFGIVIERAGGLHSTLEVGVMGTPAYMSPEQAAGRPVSEATDWYALGVMIYEALTGNVPFDGSYLEVMQQKQELDAIPPSHIVSGVPADLDELCVQLLQRNPSARPHGLSVLRALERKRSASVRPPTSSVPAEPDAPFVGRGEEMSALRRHLNQTDRGKPVVAFVHGPSGIGKTTLVERFIVEQRIAERAVVLKGRCYERELVPFKAFDTLIDALSRYLRRLPSVEAAETLPRDIMALAQLFPVLRRVDVVTMAKRRARLPSDRKELRRRAFAALKELLCRIADRMPLVLFVDDLQWGDVDSARLMSELINGPDAPAMLLILNYRSGDVRTSPCLQVLFDSTRENGDAEIHEVPVGPLSDEESRELARQLLGADVPAAVASVGRECQGNPHLLTELVRHVVDSQNNLSASLDTRQGLVTFERALLKRVGELSEGARTLLEMVCVAGRPVAEEVLALVSTFSIDLQEALVELRGAKLIRGVGTHARRAIETYHDRIREVVMSAMDPEEMTRWHRRLASTLEASGSEDLEAVTEHLLGAGDTRRAQIYAIRAATQAAEALAFEKAARLFAIAVRHEEDEAWGHELLVQWAESLVNAGRAHQAASVYFEAARSAPGDEPQVLQRKAGVQLLLCGHQEQAMDLLAEGLAEVGIQLPADLADAHLRLAATRESLRARGLSFVPRDEQAVPSEQLEHLDMLWSVAFGVSLAEPERSEPLLADYLRAALDAGEPLRIVRGLCAYHAMVDLPHAAKSGQGGIGALPAAREILATLGDDDRGVAWLAFAEGHEALWAGHYGPAVTSLLRAEDLLRTRCAGAAPEMRLCRVLVAYLWVAFGQLDRLRRITQWNAEAEEHEDLIAATRLRLATTLSALTGGEPERAVRRVEQTMARWGGAVDDLTEHLRRLALTQCLLYRGEPAECRKHLARYEVALGSMLGPIPVVRAHALCARARLRVAAAVRSPDADQLLREAEEDVRSLSALRISCFENRVRLVRAAIAYRRSDADTALALLEAVLADPDEDADSLFIAAAAQRAKGQLVGAEEGMLLIARADATLREHGVGDPARFTRLHAPGF